MGPLKAGKILSVFKTSKNIWSNTWSDFSACFCCLVKNWSRKSNACRRPWLCHLPWRMPRPKRLESAFGPGLAPRALGSRPWPRPLALGLPPSAPRALLSPSGPRARGPRPLGLLSPLASGQGPCRMACRWPKLTTSLAACVSSDMFRGSRLWVSRSPHARKMQCNFAWS